MTTLKDHDHRITTVEGQLKEVKEVQACHGESIYRLRRESIEIRLGMHTLLEHFGLPRVTRDQVDEVLDAE